MRNFAKTINASKQLILKDFLSDEVLHLKLVWRWKWEEIAVVVMGKARNWNWSKPFTLVRKQRKAESNTVKAMVNKKMGLVSV